MLKRFIAIALIFSTLGLLVRFTVPYLWYYSNFHYIATELCINRHNPNIECNGSCQLKKMVEHHSTDHSKHQEKTTLPPDVRPFISFYHQQKGDYFLSRKTAEQELFTFQILLATQFIKAPATPPPISLV